MTSEAHAELAAAPTRPALAEREPGMLPKHMPGLDGVRGLAVVMVMWFHFAQGSQMSSLGLYWRLAVLGQSGVDLFFVLSGFLITGILADSKGGDHYFRNFYARRTLRIFPLYYGVLLVTFLLLPLLFALFPATGSLETLGLHHAEQQGWLWTYTSNLRAVLTGQVYDGPFGHFWSLSVEEQFYLAWPAVVWLCSRRAAMWLCALGCLGAFLLRVPMESVAFGFTLTRADSLLAGAWVALAVRRPGGVRALRPWVAWIAVIGVPVLVLISATKSGSHLLTWVYTTKFSVYSVWYAAIVLLAALATPGKGLGRVVCWPVLQRLGKYAYGMYVYHGVFGPWLASILPGTYLEKYVGPVPAIVLHSLVATAVVFVIAAASYHLYEAPILSLKRYFEYGHRAPTVAERAG